jgi:hypothetical protein
MGRKRRHAEAAKGVTKFEIGTIAAKSASRDLAAQGLTGFPR